MSAGVKTASELTVGLFFWAGGLTYWTKLRLSSE